MELQSWLFISAAVSNSDDPFSPPPYSLRPKSLSSDGFSDSQLSSSESDDSIQSNISLATFPSLPSLDKLTLSGDFTATVVNCTTLQHRCDATVNCLAIHNNLLYAAVGNEINVYKLIDNSLVDIFNTEKTSSGAVKSIAFLGGKIFTAHQDCRIRVWTINDQKQHKQIASLPTVSDRLCRSILPRNYVNVRRHRTKLCVEHYDTVSGLGVSQIDDSIVSISWDRSIKFWGGRRNHCLQSINRAHDDAINAVAVSIDGFIYTGSADRSIKVWQKLGKKYALITTLEKHKSAVNALSLNQNGSVLFSGSCDRSILVWEKQQNTTDHHMAARGTLKGHTKAILCLINIDEVLFSGSADRTVRIWRRRVDGDYTCLSVLDGHRSPVRSLAAEEYGGGDNDAKLKVISGSFDGEIKVWRVAVCRADFC